MKRINFYLTNKEINTLKMISEETGLSVSELVRRSIDTFLKEKDKNVYVEKN